VLAPRVEEKPGAGFHDGAQPVPCQEVGHAAGLPTPARRQGAEGVMVERQGAALVAQIRKNGEGVVQAVVGEPVGVVAEAQIRDCRSFPNYRSRATLPIWRLAAAGKPSKFA